MSSEKEIGIIGSGGQADEAESFLGKKAVFRAINKEYIDPESEHELIDVASPSDEHRDTPVVAAIGAPAIRQMLIDQWPGEKFETIVSEHAIVDESAKIGEGCLIAPRAVITTNVEIGKHTLVNVASTIQHDTKIGDFVTVGPGVHIAGKVEIGDGVFVGIGASISNSVRIADGVVVGAGAVVINSIEEENSVYVGVPAKMIGTNEGWLREV